MKCAAIFWWLISFSVTFIATGFQPAMAQGRIWFAEVTGDYARKQKISTGGRSFQNSGSIGWSLNINKGGRGIAAMLQYSRFPVKLDPAGIPGEKSHSLNEFFFGLRYYPMLPNLRVGTKVALRVTAGALAGAYFIYHRQKEDFSDNWKLTWTRGAFDPVLFAGVCLSPFRNTSGLVVKLNYRPVTYEKANLLFTQPLTLQAGIFIGPRVGR